MAVEVEGVAARLEAPQPAAGPDTVGALLAAHLDQHVVEVGMRGFPEHGRGERDRPLPARRPP